MRISELQREVAAWARETFPSEQPYHPLLGLTEEVGELAHAHLKAEQGIKGTQAEHHAAKVDAVADILIFLCHYCELNDIDLDSAVFETWREVRRRNYPKTGVSPREPVDPADMGYLASQLRRID